MGAPCPRRAPVWCPRCSTDIVDAIAGLPAAVGRLPAHGRLRIPAGDGDRRSSGVRIPSPSPSADLRDEVVHWVCRLEERLRQHVGDAAPIGPRRLDVPALASACRYLVVRRSALLAWDTRSAGPGGLVDGQAEAEVVGLSALQWCRRLTRAAGMDRLVHRLAMPCPACEQRALVRHDGRDEVRCATCGAEWTEDRYQLLARIYAELIAAEGVTP
jgi:hypothetical protein